MNIALIFAGGVGTRMNARNRPKQFLELHGKPIIIHTLEVFEFHPDIDKIIVVSLENAIPETVKLLRKFEITKIMDIVIGGDSGFQSILNGLSALDGKCADDDLVLIHDGVRPLIDEQNITDCIRTARKHGSAISCVPVTEGIIISDDGETVDDFPDRKILYSTKAPQVFRYREIYNLYKRAKADGLTPVESAHLCRMYGAKLYMVKSSYGNIKITTAQDYYIFRAIYEAYENSQIIGF
jgi:2-C-methyl-D-erythritol 4-phosphate cytidylyltransferase